MCQTMQDNYTYIVAEEEQDGADSGSIIILSENWLTPKKVEAFWPACKAPTQFNKILLKHEHPGEDWQLIRIKRNFFETKDLMVARKKAKQAETVSDLTDDECIPTTRKRRLPNIFTGSDSDETISDPLKIFKQTNKAPSKSGTSIARYGSSSNLLLSQQLDSQSAEIENLTESVSSPLTSLKKSVIPSTSVHAEHLSESVSSPLMSLKKPTIPSTSVHAEHLSGFQTKSLQLLSNILEQNNQILSWIRGQNELDTLRSQSTSIDLPVHLPIANEEELKIIEDYLNTDKNFADMCNHLIAFCGITPTASVNQILKMCLTNELTSKFSYRGKKGKKAFEELNIKTVIIRAVKKHFKLPIEKSIEDDIKIWLKHAPQRQKISDKKNKLHE